MENTQEVNIGYDDFDFLPLSFSKEVLYTSLANSSRGLTSRLVELCDKNNVNLALFAGQFVAWNMPETAYHLFNNLKDYPRDLLLDINDKSIAELYFRVFHETNRHEVAFSVAKKTLEMYVRAMSGLGSSGKLTEDAEYIINYRMHIIRTQGYTHLQKQNLSIFGKD